MPMNSENTDWNKAGVWICTKCMKGTDTADNLKTEWKIKLKQLGLNSEVRVMTTSCMNSCPPDQQAILIAKKDGQQEIIVCNPDKDSDQIFEKILTIAKS